MAVVSAEASICTHLASSAGEPFPFELAIVLDDQSGFTDAVVTCRTCGQHVLLEMLEWSGAHFEERVYRTSLVPKQAVAQFSKNRARGTCDVKRAGAEAHAFTQLAELTPWLVALDLGKHLVLATTRLADGTDVPVVSWRELLANGAATREWRAHFTRSSTRIENA
jgi:hypothetical protein